MTQATLILSWYSDKLRLYYLEYFVAFILCETLDRILEQHERLTSEKLEEEEEEMEKENHNLLDNR